MRFPLLSSFAAACRVTSQSQAAPPYRSLHKPSLLVAGHFHQGLMCMHAAKTAHHHLSINARLSALLFHELTHPPKAPITPLSFLDFPFLSDHRHHHHHYSYLSSCSPYYTLSLLLYSPFSLVLLNCHSPHFHSSILLSAQTAIKTTIFPTFHPFLIIIYPFSCYYPLSPLFTLPYTRASHPARFHFSTLPTSQTTTTTVITTITPTIRPLLLVIYLFLAIFPFLPYSPKLPLTPLSSLDFAICSDRH